MKGRESSFGEHLKGYGSDVKSTYIDGKSGVLDRAMGGAMVVASVALEGPDHVYDAVLGRKYQAPSGIAGRVRRDIGALVKDVFTLRPLRAAGDAWKLLTSDVPLDTGDLLTRNAISRALAA